MYTTYPYYRSWRSCRPQPLRGAGRSLLQSCTCSTKIGTVRFCEDLHDAGKLSSEKAFAEEYISDSDDEKAATNFTLKPVNWGEIAAPANEKSHIETPRPRRARSLSTGSVKGNTKLTQDQEQLLRKAWKAAQSTQKSLGARDEDFEGLSGRGSKSKSVKMKIDPGENDSRAPRHTDRDSTDQLGGPNLPQDSELIDVHDDEGSSSKEETKKKSKSTSVAPVEPMSHKQIKKEIKRLKHLAKLNNSKNRRHPGRLECCSVEPMSFEMADMVEQISKGPVKKGSKEKGRSVSLNPNEQVNPKSYLSKAFEDLTESESEGGSMTSSSSSESDLSEPSSSDTKHESSLSSSDGDSSSSGDTSSMDSSTDGRHGSKCKKSQKKSKAKAKKARAKGEKRAKATRSTLKPTAPDKYNGTPDPIKFVRFINQSKSYLKRGKVPDKDAVAKISNFLTDKAYNYYLSDAREYATQLKNLFQIIGHASKREKGRWLWKGFAPCLRQKLFEAKLDPETSKWGDIVDHAEMFEIAHNMGMDNKNQRETKPSKGSTHGGSNNHSGNSNGSSGNGEGSSSNKNCGNQNCGHSNQNRDKNHSGGSSRRLNNGSSKSKTNNGSNINKNKLSTDELKHYRDEGLCYRCGESGHIGRNCDKGQNIKGGRSGPPGV
ncbi:hypothetical protein DXG01_014150 [Tephrocybe rancida]|nr:hypothetical protein DXG01_014150 [Tephrocybe rancida]